RALARSGAIAVSGPAQQGDRGTARHLGLYGQGARADPVPALRRAQPHRACASSAEVALSGARRRRAPANISLQTKDLDGRSRSGNDARIGARLLTPIVQRADAGRARSMAAAGLVSRASTSMSKSTITSQIVKAMNAQANEPLRLITAPMSAG